MSGKIRMLVRGALIAAAYVVLAVVFAPFSFGTVQIRVSEALTLLPVLFPEAVAGVAVGCFFSNLLFSTPIDVAVGTAATLLAALLTRRLRNVRWKGFVLPASLPPVVLNALFVGLELTFLYYKAEQIPFGWFYLMNIAAVGAGQLVSCSILGVLLVYAIEKNPALWRIGHNDGG